MAEKAQELWKFTFFIVRFTASRRALSKARFYGKIISLEPDLSLATYKSPAQETWFKNKLDKFVQLCYPQSR